MTTGRNEAQIALVVRARDEASRQLRSVGQQTEGLRGRFQQLQRSMLGLSVAGIGAGFAARQIAGDIQQTEGASARANATARLLGPAFEAAFEDAQSEFSDLAREFNVRVPEIEEAFGVLQASANRPIRDIDALRDALALAEVAELDSAEAARIVGEALKGNIDPLREVLGLQRGISRERAFEILREEAEESRTVIDEFRGEFNLLRDAVSELATGDANEGFRLISELSVLQPPDFGNVDDQLTDLANSLSENFSPDSPGGRAINAIADFFAGDFFNPGQFKTNVDNSFSGLVDSAEQAFQDLPESIKAIIEGRPFGEPGGQIGPPERPDGGGGGRDPSPPGEDDAFTGPRTRRFRIVGSLLGGGEVERTVRAESRGEAARIFRTLFGEGEMTGIQSITALQRGGIVNRPTLALLGENNKREAVVPLERGGGIGTSVVINVGSVDTETRVRQIARETQRLLREESRRGVGI